MPIAVILGSMGGMPVLGFRFNYHPEGGDIDASCLIPAK